METVENVIVNNRAKILQDAEKLVNGDRNAQYGDPSQDFQRTAELWSTFLGIKIEPWQVAPMMALLKLSRISWNPRKEDSWTDLAGYAACGWDVVVQKQPVLDDGFSDVHCKECNKIFKMKINTQPEHHRCLYCNSLNIMWKPSHNG